MSLGYAARCKKELEDEKAVLYSYHAENWNLPHEQAARLEAVEGAFTIEKSSYPHVIPPVILSLRAQECTAVAVG